MAKLVSSFSRFALTIAFLIVVTFGFVFAFDQLIAPQMGLADLFVQTARTVIVVVFGSAIMLFMRRSKPLISKHVGVHSATIFQFLMILAAGIVLIFAVLNVFHVSPTALLIGGGVVSIVVGLVVSTFVGNILAGTLVLVTSPFRIGDIVLVNNIPGRVEEITAMVTRIKTDIGGIVVVPNTAIVQGGVIVTRLPDQGPTVPSRLPYSLGDRVFTTYMNGEGEVTEVTPFHTKIILDSGREITFLNTGVFTGAVAVARVKEKSQESKEA